MPYFAVVLGSGPPAANAILMMLDERYEAEEIAVELRRRGQQVNVHELAVKPSQPASAAPRAS